MPRSVPFLPRRFSFTHALAAIALLVCVSPAWAQDRLFALVPQNQFVPAPRQAHLIEIDTRPESFGQVRRDFLVPPTGALPGLSSIGGGRFLVWLSANGDAVHVFDTRTNRLGTVPGLPPRVR